MRLSALAIALALAGCRPATRGLCQTDGDCRSGSLCSRDHICLAPSGNCNPACGLGEICTGGACQPLRPTVAIKADSGGLLISPAFPSVTVTVVAPGVTVTGLHVEVDGPDKLAFADLAAAQTGDNAVVLGHFVQGVEGQATIAATLSFQLPDGSSDRVNSVAVPAAYDASPPAVTSIFFPTGQGQVSGWFPPSGADVEVRAEVADGPQGSGPKGATLTFDPPCPASAPCSYQGNLVPTSSGMFSFALPRAAQGSGSESPLRFHVTATDRAGNVSAGVAGALQIDAKAPAIGAIRLLTQGATGEDGQTWFAGGAGAAPIDLAVAISDRGVGLDPASLVLQLVAADVDADPGPIAGTLPTPADGTVRFRVPAATAVTSREGKVHFSVTAKDRFGQTSTLAPAQAAPLGIDAVPPSIALAAPWYPEATPAIRTVCNADDSATFACGRGPSANAVRALRDDALPIYFDAYDCGSGLVAGGATQVASVSITAAGQTFTGTATLDSLQGSAGCGNANQIHRYKVQLDVGNDLPALDAPDSSGVVHLAITASTSDLVGLYNQVTPDNATGPGVLSVALWRWKRQLASGQQATGAPLVASDHSVVLGTKASTALAVKADGSVAWGPLALADVPSGELAVGPSGVYYAAVGNGVYLISSTGAVSQHFTVSTTVFGSPPAVFQVSGSDDIAVIAPTSRANSLAPNLYQFHGSQQGSLNLQTTAGGNLTGLTLGAAQLFVSHDAGFSSTGYTASGFGSQVALNYGDPSKSAALAPPSLQSQSSATGALPIFPAGDGHLKQAKLVHNGCNVGTTDCWLNQWSQPSGTILITPAFDERQIVTTDSTGVVAGWSPSTGAQLWQTASPVGGPPQLTSGPVILQAGSANTLAPVLVVGGDGRLRRLSPPATPGAPTEVALIGAGQLTPFSNGTTPPFAAVDARGPGGVVYLTDGGGWLFAVQIDDSPAPASKTIWPRPSRDRCNSRNADSTCQ